jgi:hypothetical protein
LRNIHLHFPVREKTTGADDADAFHIDFAFTADPLPATGCLDILPAGADGIQERLAGGREEGERFVHAVKIGIKAQGSRLKAQVGRRDEGGKGKEERGRRKRGKK